MKIFYICSLVVTVLFFITIGYFINAYAEASWDNFLNELAYYDDYSYSYSYDYGNSELDDITMQGALAGVAFIIFYSLLFSFTLKHIKRTTAKVMSIIGLSLSGIFLLISFVPLSDPGAADFDEFGPALIPYGLVMLAFCIVNLVQAVRNEAAAPQGLVIDEI